MKRHTRKTIKTLLTAGALALTVLLLAGLPGLGCHMDSLYLEEIEEKVAADEEGARSYTIGYFGNNSTSGSVPVDSAQYHQGDTVEVLGNTGNLERTNYTFDGWNTQEDGEGNRRDPGSTFLMGKDNVHLFAQWTINTPTVTFMAQGGSTPIPATKIVTYGELYSSLATTTRTGYSFDGWYDASSGGNEITSGSTVTKNIDHALYARWSLITYNINYYINGGTNHSSNPANYSVETSTIVLNAPSREGYQFGGWYDNPGFNGTAINQILSGSVGNIDLYAKWAGEVRTVLFNEAGGSAPSPQSKAVTFGSEYGTLPTTARAGYDFNGWFTSSSGGTRILSTTIVSTTGDHTLYAQWTPSSFAVTFNRQAGTVPVPADKTVTYGSMYGTLATTSRTGYTFKGWYTSSSGGTKIISTTTVSTPSNHTLYAQWTANSITVTFERGGGTVPNPNQKTVTYGNQYGTLATSTRLGYTLAGWEDQFGNLITPTTTVTIVADHSLYPRWE